MPTDILSPNQNIAMTYPGSRRGMVKIYIEASGPITVIVTTPTGVALFQNNDAIQPVYDRADEVPFYNRSLALPRHASWSLLIINFDRRQIWDAARAVHWEVVEK